MDEVERDEPARGVRIAIGILSAVAVPFGVTGLYRVVELPGLLGLVFPFALCAAVAVWLWVATRWKSAAIGLGIGLAIYGAFLTWLLYEFSQGMEGF